jgi:hypothetical protein
VGGNVGEKFEIRNQKLTVGELNKMGGLSRFARLEEFGRAERAVDVDGELQV